MGHLSLCECMKFHSKNRISFIKEKYFKSPFYLKKKIIILNRNIILFSFKSIQNKRSKEKKRKKKQYIKNQIITPLQNLLTNKVYYNSVKNREFLLLGTVYVFGSLVSHLLGPYRCSQEELQENVVLLKCIHFGVFFLFISFHTK